MNFQLGSLFKQIGIGGPAASTPVIESAEASECGLACLAMVAAHHGLDVDLNGLRQRFSVSLMGLRLKSIIEMAEQLGFITRPLRLEPESLAQLVLPAILHWDLNHFVVLTGVTAKEAKINDPAIGARKIPLKEFGSHFTGVALELRKSTNFAALTLRQPIKLNQLWSQISGLATTLISAFILSAALAVVTFAAPFQMQLVVDDAVYQSDHDLLTVIALGFASLTILQTSIQYLRDRAVLVISNLFGYQLVGNVVRHLMRLPTSYFVKRHLGDILSRIRSTEPIRNAVSQGIVSAIIDGAIATIAVVILLFYSPLLTSVVLGSIILYLVVILFAFPLMRGQTRAQILATAAEQSNLMENMRGAVTIKVMGGEADREGRWRNLYSRVINAGIALGKMQLNMSWLQGIIFGLQHVLVVYLGAEMVIDGKGFSVGMLISYISFRQTFSDRLLSLITQVMQFRLLSLHLNRLGDVVQTPAETLETSPSVEAIMGAVTLKRIAFKYGRDDPPVLANCSLDIAAGSYVAIVGASGCGKSTLLKVMLGLYRPDAGEIFLDGQKATSRLWRTWRSNIGYVSQDDQLFAGSIADNIAFFDPILEMERVISAAKAAAIHDEIGRMPMQYLSMVGDMGSVLSGGQRQRVLLARALYRNPKILILDEGTAHLDETTEATIGQLISELPITRIVVTHRPALLRRAHKIATMQNGAIVDLIESPQAQ